MKTVTIQIGNTDDKLTQKEWSAFVLKVRWAITGYEIGCHFHGFSEGDKPWQNACWVFSMNDDAIPILKDALKAIREQYRQDSIAWTEGETKFV